MRSKRSNLYALPNLPQDQQTLRVLQDLVDRVNYATTELSRVREAFPDSLRGLASKENPQPGIITIPSQNGDGFVRVNEEGVIVSYTNPVPVLGMHRNLFLDTTTTTVANTVTETSLMGPGDFGSTKLIDPNIASIGRTFRLYFSGILGNTGTPTLDVRLKLAGTVIHTFTPVFSLSASAAAGWEIDVFATITAVSSLTGHAGAMAWSFGESGAQGETNWSARNSNTISVSFLTPAEWSLTAQWGTANVANSLSYKFGCIDIVR